MSNRNYKLQIFRNKAYRDMYTGRESQCFNRVDSMYHRCRIIRGTAKNVVAQFPERSQRLPFREA